MVYESTFRDVVMAVAYSYGIDIDAILAKKENT